MEAKKKVLQTLVLLLLFAGLLFVVQLSHFGGLAGLTGQVSYQRPSTDDDLDFELTILRVEELGDKFLLRYQLDNFREFSREFVIYYTISDTSRNIVFTGQEFVLLSHFESRRGNLYHDIGEELEGEYIILVDVSDGKKTNSIQETRIL